MAGGRGMLLRRQVLALLGAAPLHAGMAAEALHGWAHEFAEGRWIATGGGLPHQGSLVVHHRLTGRDARGLDECATYGRHGRRRHFLNSTAGSRLGWPWPAARNARGPRDVGNFFGALLLGLLNAPLDIAHGVEVFADLRAIRSAQRRSLSLVYPGASLLP